jgi:hypothetical protein
MIISAIPSTLANSAEAAKGAFPNRDCNQSRYTDVEVVLMRWGDDNRLGVSCELEDLCKVFTKGFGFKSRIWLIPTEDPLPDIMGKTLTLVKEAGTEGKLLVVYYAGHAAMNEARQQVWFRYVFVDLSLMHWLIHNSLINTT